MERYSPFKTRLSVPFGIHPIPHNSSDSRAIWWGKSGVKFYGDRVMQGVGYDQADSQIIGVIHR